MIVIIFLKMQILAKNSHITRHWPSFQPIGELCRFHRYAGVVFFGVVIQSSLYGEKISVMPVF